MKSPEERTVAKILLTGVLIAAISLVFYLYSNRNSERISQQNANYIKNSTIETANWLEDILKSAKYSIANIARLYGETLADKEVEPENLRGFADRSIFDYVEFVNAEGIDVNIEGEYVDVSDRAYFIKGMQGESGMDGTYTSEATGERQVIFYAPVQYEGEIIGVLTGHYREERMRNILAKVLFDEQAPAFLCLADGTIVSCVGVGELEGTNVLDYMAGSVSAEEMAEIKTALEQESACGFSYETEQGMTMAYMTSLEGNTWTIIQLFPVNALTKMQRAANSAGITLETSLIILFVVYLLFMLLQEWYQKKKLLKGKQEAERIIAGVNRLFHRFIVVNFETNEYRCVNDQGRGFLNIPDSGQYSELLDLLEDKFVPEYDMVSMTQTLSKESIQRALTERTPFERYEYQIHRDEGDAWENMAVIALEWKEGRPVSVLLAIEEITGQKKRELRTQTALREACQSAEAANHAKSEFLSRMSHDIRTPMNAIMGMTAIAAMHMDDKLRLEDCLGKITVSSRHLLRLINEVLDMSKIESGRLELTDEEFDLSETVKELLEIFHPQIEKKNQDLSVMLNGLTHEKVIGDAQHLSQILVNIMGNAVKFTPDGGSISLHISETPSRVAGSGCYEFVFTDSGIGMDQEFVDRIFEPFTRASDSRTSKTEGTGLGMSIAKNIANMMNGDIQVKSKKGEGTQVRVTVFLQYNSDAEEDLQGLAGQRVMVVDDELATCENACRILESIHMPSDYYTDGDEAVEALVRDHEEKQEYVAVILDWKMPKKDGLQVTREIRARVGADMPIIILSAYDWSAIEQEALDAGVNEFIAKPLFKSRLVYVMKKVLLGQDEEKKGIRTVLKLEDQFVHKKLLLVEDNEMNMEIAREILTMAGFTVDGAENGKEAVERLTESAPDTYQAVLMDIQMPVMNGYEATKAIRQSEREDLKTLPIFAMTADAFSADIRKAEEAGMNGHIAKPIDIRKLMDVLMDWIK